MVSIKISADIGCGSIPTGAAVVKIRGTSSWNILVDLFHMNQSIVMPAVAFRVLPTMLAQSNGNGVTIQFMNCRISEPMLRSVCRELLNKGKPVSHRALRQILRDRFGAAGRTARILKIWREESVRAATVRAEGERRQQALALPADVRELQERLATAEARAQAQTVRAELAELREQSHQDRWALEIDDLREKLRRQPAYAREVQTLQTTVSRLTVELAVWRGTQGEGAAPKV
jgi:hypothetical protein